MTSVSGNVYIDKLDDLVNKHYNTYHNTIRMKHLDVKSNTYIEFNKEFNNNKDTKVKSSDFFMIWKYKSISTKGYTPNKMLCWERMLSVILKEKKLLEGFIKNNCKNLIKRNLELKK